VSAVKFIVDGVTRVPSIERAQLLLDNEPRHAGSSVELFAGGGGMALGIHDAGFRHLAVSELEGRACLTLLANGATLSDQEGDDTPSVPARRTGSLAADWPLFPGDCHDKDWSRWRGEADLLAGGPPCQPWSLGGVHRGMADERNLFHEAARALDEIRPRAFFFENVRGLSRPTFRPYFDYIMRSLSAPHLGRRNAEGWEHHMRRLRRHGSKVPPEESYRVSWDLVNAADYGVPQQRWRVLIVGFRADLDVDWEFPPPTHSADALLWSQMTGTYWEEYGIEPRPPKASASRLRRLARDVEPSAARWRTVRDAVHGLPEPAEERETDGIYDHRGVPGARLYHGHNGSDVDWPSKSIKAGVHGVPGGEHIVVRPDGSYRYMTIRECARMQGFPDGYRFEGPRTEAMRQIGNAVPVLLARQIASVIADKLSPPLHALTDQAASRPGSHLADDGGRSTQGLEAGDDAS